MIAPNSFGRIAFLVVTILLVLVVMLTAQNKGYDRIPSFSYSAVLGATKGNDKDISYDLTVPPSSGCEELVNDLQQKIIHAYSERFRGIRYANIWGYLETGNKGDAAIWTAQQILLSMLGIETMEACRFMHKGCDMERFVEKLEEHRPHSAIIMAGGGNFNDYYWEDQPSRMKMIEAFTNTTIRAFPQSIYMTKPERINMTRQALTQHHDLQLAARDQPSYDWLTNTFDMDADITTDLIPDIAFMWGNRSDFRLNTEKTHDVLILARKDKEISAGNSSEIAFGEGELDLGGSTGNVTYLKVDWKFTETPEIDKLSPASEAKLAKAQSRDKEKRNQDSLHQLDKRWRENGKNQRAYAKAIAGFELLGSARFVITDRLHGHILSTLIGVPHVLMDSKLGKNLNFHNTWTRDCKCTRITSNIGDALDVARLWFESQK